jgi:hypothetical protein
MTVTGTSIPLAVAPPCSQTTRVAVVVVVADIADGPEIAIHERRSRFRFAAKT